ncbi:hypothetical protein [Mucilaginibacter hurinus]|nr:hypothetical protein [Mucilaginibacter hurinus]
MLTFEEFFKKKKIDIAALRQNEPALFTEFTVHYNRMGEKSFDHTKKYWFNKLRKLYHLAPEVKAKPLRNENRLAEQTILDSLSAPAENAPKPGFTPRFKANAPKPANPEITDEAIAESNPEPAPKPGFTPRFKSGVTKPAEQAQPDAGTAGDVTPKSPGFTPRFKAGVTKPTQQATPGGDKTAQDTPAASEKLSDKPQDVSKKSGFTPRFKAGVTKTAEQLTPVEGKGDVQEPAAIESPKPLEESTKKPGFTPRFKARVTKPADESTPDGNTKDESTQEDKVADSTADKPAVPKKPGFTPRFKAGVTQAVPPVKAEPLTDTENKPQPPSVRAPRNERDKEAETIREANVPEIDFTGKFIPKRPKPGEVKLDKLAQQANILASNFKDKFKANHVPKHIARTQPENKSAEKNETAGEPETPTVSATGKKPYKPRFNPKKLPPKSNNG